MTRVYYRRIMDISKTEHTSENVRYEDRKFPTKCPYKVRDSRGNVRHVGSYSCIACEFCGGLERYGKDSNSLWCNME